MITNDDAATQASYARDAVDAMCSALNIERGSYRWIDRIAPFAVVIAALVTAAAAKAGADKDA